MFEAFVPTPDALLPLMTPRQELALLARVLWREGYGRRAGAHLSCRADGDVLQTSPTTTWDQMHPREVVPMPDHERGDRPDAEVVLRDRPPYGSLWADIGEVPPAMDQSSSAGGGVVGRDLLLDPVTGVTVTGVSVRAVHERAVAFEIRCRRAWVIRAAGAPLEPVLPAWYRTGREALDGNGFIGLWEAMARQEIRTGLGWDAPCP